MGQIITEEIINKMIERKKKGISVPEIAKELGVGKTTVRKYLHIYGEGDFHDTEKINKCLVDKLYEEYKRGESLSNLGRKYNLATSTISTYVARRKKDEEIGRTAKEVEITEDKAQGVTTLDLSAKGNIEKINGEVYLSEEQLDHMIKMYEQGVSLTQIGKIYGVARSTVTRKIYRKMGIPKNKDINKSIERDKLQGLKIKPTIKEVVNQESATSEPIQNLIEKSSILEEADKEVLNNEETNEERPSLIEKIMYCNEKYGEGRWRFLTREELRRDLKRDLKLEF